MDRPGYGAPPSQPVPQALIYSSPGSQTTQPHRSPQPLSPGQVLVHNTCPGPQWPGQRGPSDLALEMKPVSSEAEYPDLALTPLAVVDACWSVGPRHHALSPGSQNYQALPALQVLCRTLCLCLTLSAHFLIHSSPASRSHLLETQIDDTHAFKITETNRLTKNPPVVSRSLSDISGAAWMAVYHQPHASDRPEMEIIVSILQTRKLRPGEVKGHAQGCPARRATPRLETPPCGHLVPLRPRCFPSTRSLSPFHQEPWRVPHEPKGQGLGREVRSWELLSPQRWGR